MSNPYYRSRSGQQNNPGFANPLLQPQRYPPASSSRTSFVQYDADNSYPLSDPVYRNDPNSERHQANPYYDPYTNFSNVHVDSQSLNPSSENLVARSGPGGYTSKHHDDEYPPYPPPPIAHPDQELRPPQAPPDIVRPDSPFDGVYLDRAPVWEKLNPEQRKIASQFPKDIDDENGGKTGLQAVWELCKNWRLAFKLKYLHWWILLIITGVVVALVTLYHQQIVDWLTPISKKANSVPWGWTIPVAILFVLSFPPLFGHEIVLVLVGIVFGLWIGFGIATLGTLLGEIGNFYAFKYCLRSTAAKYEKKNVHYACMAEMVREGGFLVVLLARLSAIPGHFTTAVFATVGMNIFIFTLAALLAMPKQLVIVYFGVAIEQSGDGHESTASKVIKYVVLALSVILTIWTAHWLYKRMEKIRPQVQLKLRQRRYEMLTQARYSQAGPAPGSSMPADDKPTTSVVTFGEYDDDSDKNAYELATRTSHQHEWNAPRPAGMQDYDYDHEWQTNQVGPSNSNERFADAGASGSNPNLAAARQRPTINTSLGPAPPAPTSASNPYQEHMYPAENDSSKSPVEHQQRSPIRAQSNGPIHFHRPLRKPTVEPVEEMPGLRADYQYASDIGSVYMMHSEVGSPDASLQPGQIVSPSPRMPSSPSGAPVPALERSMRLSPLPSQMRPGQIVSPSPTVYDAPPPAYAHSAYQPPQSPQERVSSDVRRYELRD